MGVLLCIPPCGTLLYASLTCALIAGAPAVSIDWHLRPAASLAAQLQCTAPKCSQVSRGLCGCRGWMYCYNSACSKLKGMQDSDAISQSTGAAAVAGSTPANRHGRWLKLLDGRPAQHVQTRFPAVCM